MVKRPRILIDSSLPGESNTILCPSYEKSSDCSYKLPGLASGIIGWYMAKTKARHYPWIMRNDDSGRSFKLVPFEDVCRSVLSEEESSSFDKFLTKTSLDFNQCMADTVFRK